MKRDELFEVLAPPVGGLTRLRANLAEAPPRRFGLPVVGLALALLLVVGVFSAIRSDAVDLRPAVHGSVTVGLLGVDVARPTVELEADQAAGLQRLPSGNPNVVLYRVAAINPAQQP